MDSIALVEFFIQFIMDDDTIRLQDLCTKIQKGLNLISVESSDKLLSQLLDMAGYYSRVNGAKIIYDTWKTSHFGEERFSLLAYMLGRNTFSDRAVSIVVQARDEDSFDSLFDEIVSRDDSPETIVALNRLFKLSGSKVSYSKLLELKNKITDEEQPEDLPFPGIKAFINTHIEDIAPFAKKPDYLTPSEKLADDLEAITVEVKSVVNTLSIDEKIELLTAGLASQGITIQELDKNKELLQQELTKMPEEEQESLLKPVAEDLSLTEMTDNEELFKIFGPNHPVYGTELDDSYIAYPCQRFGGCRMFLCVCSEAVNDSVNLGRTLDYIDENPDEIEWFRSACDFCHLKIEKKCWAVRRPLDGGGFVGNYCSWSCTRQDTPDDEIAIHALIDHFESKVKEIGIYDREYTNQ